LDFTGSIINEFRGLPDFWWLRLIVAAIGGGLIWILLAKIKERKINRRDVVICGLLTAYVVFILMETVIGRTVGKRNAIFIPFWSYGKSDYVSEILLNYILFIPFGFLMYLHTGRTNAPIITGFASSSLIELTQLIFCIGLFEFDDIIGNTIGCIIGVFLGKVARHGFGSYRNYCE